MYEGFFSLEASHVDVARLDVTELWVSLAWLCMFSHSHAHTMSLYTHRVLGTSVLGSGAGMPLDLQQPPPGDDVCGVHLWHPHGTVSFVMPSQGCFR